MEKDPLRQRPSICGVVPVTDGFSGQYSKHESEHHVHHPEGQRLCTLGSACDTDRPETAPIFQERCDEPGQILRTIFPIGIHGHHNVAVSQLREHETQSAYDGALVTDIEWRGHKQDVVETGQLRHIGIESSGVVHDYEFDRLSHVLVLDSKYLEHARVKYAKCWNVQVGWADDPYSSFGLTFG
jgi:hypothetical protein